ncbi:MAG: cell surface protein SprA, partial [Chitinispirillaceae bacterium]|nr:cell surface protein SprA [Chitinispirillaceae bacterium]
MHTPGIVKIVLSTAAAVLWAVSASAQGFYAERPYAGAFGSPEAGASPAGGIWRAGQVLTLAMTLFRDSTVIDFEKRQVTLIRYDPLGFVIRTHHYGELNEYLMERARSALIDTWLGSSMLSKSAAGQEKQQRLKLAWELPVQYPSWAQRVLGNEPPRLSINGSMRIKMAYEDVRRKESAALGSQSAGPGFNFEPQYQFSVAGSVGRLINVNISANSESDVDVNDPLKNFHIDYKASKEGELEDEIVQEVIAGYTGFSMPNTQLSGYSESHEGLFGIKITSRVGPVTITTIASNERGESQKLSISNSGAGGPGGTSITKSDGFKTNRRFFLDTAYIRHYNRKYALNGGNSNYVMPETLKVVDFEVWKKIFSPNEVAVIRQDPSRTVREFFVDSMNQISYNFQRLEENRHYRVYPSEGWIHFLPDSVSIIEGQDMIAIYLRTGTGAISRGGDRNPLDSNYPGWLWVMKPEQYIDSMGADPGRFRLMWRNVYEIPSEVPDISKFMLRLYHINQDDQDTQKTNVDTVYLSDVMGLTKNAVPTTERQDIFNFEYKEIVFPPYDTGAFGNEPFGNPGLTDDKGNDLRDTLFYRFGPNSNVLASSGFVPKFTIEMSGASKKTSFDLGYGVMENTVQVTADGRQLQANVDYVLNTEIGRLELVSPSAKAADRIEINYQRESLFMPEQKLFLGARAEMKLPFISDKSLAGLSVLWQSTSVAQQVPRINQEPYSKLLLDFNTRMDFQPAWMTALVNRLPFVNTEAQSNATVDVEVAHSRMNPNREGEAYVDDFESSKQIYSLGESYRNWFRASPALPRDSLPVRPPAWDWYWFTPVYSDETHAVLRTQMWSDTERINTGMAKYEPVLRLHCTPAPAEPSLSGRFNRAWAGIMTPIPVNLSDRKRDQYFELLLKCPKGPAGMGTLRLQMGRMREDICINGFPPNGLPDKEDTSTIWRENRDPALDRGLDTVSGQSERYAIPNSALTGWDTLRYGSDSLGDWKEDPARDNYSKAPYDEEHPEYYRQACRYEQNGWANETEDIDNNGAVETGTLEYYHEFIIDLGDTSSPYIDRSARLVRDTTGEKTTPGCSWRRYRMPLHEIIAGFPGIRRDTGVAFDDWHNIRTVRLVWEGFDSAHLTQENQLILNGLQFVGNQWEAIRDDSGKTKIDVSAIGTREDVVYAAEAVEAENRGLIKRDPDETGIKQPEQSMRLNFHDVRRGEEALVQRTFSFQPLNVASYDSLTLVLYGRDTVEPGFLGALDRPDLKFVFRFGSDTSTYYEYRRTIRLRWDNNVCVNLRQLSDLKLAWQAGHSAGDFIDTMNADSSLHIKAPKGRQPNFANIVWLAVGVECDSSSSAVAAGYSGELWVDELKVVGIKHFNGWASRLSLQTQWADFMTLSAGLNYESGDFRTMTDNKITMGDSKLSGSLNLSTGLDKFLPSEWGFSIPVGGSMTTSLSRPQLKPNTDIYLTDRETGRPDGFLEMVKDAVGIPSGAPTESERFETKSYSRNFFVNFSKSKTSSNPAVDMLLQRLTASFQYSKSSSHTNRGRRADTQYVDSTLTSTYSGGVNYNLSPQDPPRWTKWKPLEKSSAPWLPSRWKDLEFSLLPAKIELNLASANYSTTAERRYNPEANMPLKYTRDFTLKHGIQFDYSPIRPILDFSYSVNVDRRFPEGIDGAGAGGAVRFMGRQMFALDTNGTWRGYGILRNETARSQNFKATLNPHLFDWLTNSAEYKADYTGSVTQKQNDPNSFINAAVNSGLTFSSSLSVDQLLGKAGDSSWLGMLASRIKKGCGAVGFSSVTFDYSSSANLNNRFLGAGYLDSLGVGRAGFMAYQLGLNGTNIITGDMDDRGAFGGMSCRSRNDNYDYYKDDNRAANRNFQVQTGLRLSAPFEFSLSPISLQWSTRYTVRPDSTYYDTARSFPEFRIGAQSPVLNKVKHISR